MQNKKKNADGEKNPIAAKSCPLGTTKVANATGRVRPRFNLMSVASIGSCACGRLSSSISACVIGHKLIGGAEEEKCCAGEGVHPQESTRDIQRARTGGGGAAEGE